MEGWLDNDIFESYLVILFIFCCYYSFLFTPLTLNSLNLVLSVSPSVNRDKTIDDSYRVHPNLDCESPHRVSPN